MLCGGERIRTSEGHKPLLVFKTSAFNRSATPPDLCLFCGGEGEIRTLGTRKRTHAFQACSLSHSDTSPKINPQLLRQVYSLQFFLLQLFQLIQSPFLQYLILRHRSIFRLNYHPLLYLLKIPL